MTPSPRTPPQNQPAEQALLGALLANNRAYERVEFLRPLHFADPIHGLLFAAIQRRLEAGQLVDAVTLRAEFENAGTLAEVGGVAYLAQLLSATVGIINAGEYGRVIHDCWMRRQLIDLGETMVNRAYGEPEAEVMLATDQVERAEADLMAVVEGAGDAAPLASASDAVSGALALWEKAHTTQNGLTGITTGFAALDRKTGGWQPGDFIVLGARPSMGKTGLAAAIACRAAAAGKRVLFISAEMRAAQIGARLVAAMSRLPLNAVLKAGIIDPGENEPRPFRQSEVDAMVAAAGRLRGLPLFFDDRSAPSISAIRARARRMKRDRKAGGLDLVIVDYLGLAKASKEAARQNRNAEVSEISQGLKALAKDLQVPVVALSQLSRDVDKRDDHTPVLSDLRDSGTLEQDADIVMFLYRAHYYLTLKTPERREREKAEDFDRRVEEWHRAVADSRGKADLILAKQRQGEVGRVRLRFQARTTWFFDESEPDDAPAL